MSSPFDFTGPSRILAANPLMRRKPTDPTRVNQFLPLTGADQGQIDRDRNAKIVGKANHRRSQ